MATIQPYNIDKLNYTNYAIWSSHMQFVLRERNTWEISNGTEKEPKFDKTQPIPEDMLDFRL